MPLPYLSTLTGTARIAYPIIQRGVRSGLASRQIAETLSNAGLGIRRATLLDIMKKEREIISHGLNMRYLPYDRAPNPDRLPPALTRLRRQYSYQVELQGRIIDTQELITRNVTVASGKLLTRREAETIAMSYALDESEQYGIEVDKVQLINVLKSGELGTIL